MAHRDYILSNEPFELIIPGYPKGSDITVINTTYVRRIKNDIDGKWDPDYITILFRDNIKNTKVSFTIYEPLYTFYEVKDEFLTDYNRFFIEKDKTIPVTCKYSNILKAVAQVTGKMDEYTQNVEDNNNSENRKLHANPKVMFSDMNIEHYYRYLFYKSYKNTIFKIRKGFMDIETDIRYSNSQFPEPGEVPINAFAYCDQANNMVYQFIYNDRNNPLIEPYREKVMSGSIIPELKDFVINAVGGPKKANKFGVDKFDYKLVFFDDELTLIKEMFKLVKLTLPDFIEFWNMAFDLDYIIARLITLGEDPIEVICDERIEQHFLQFYIDVRNKNNYEERGDSVACSGYTVFLDQMIEFASRRKGRGRYQSFKLDAIGEVVAGVKKLDYSHITNNIGDLPYLDFKTFSFYNVMDVIVQVCIEHNTKDIEYVFNKCLMNNTNYAKCHRQSVYLANRFAKEFDKYGYVIGNNKNKWNEKPSTKFPGAMVGDPLHNSPAIMVHVNGRPTMLVDNSIDFDYKSLYPSIILQNNIAPNTQIGKVLIDDPENPDRVFSLNEHHDMFSSDDSTVKYSRGGEFLENLMCNVPIEFGRRWMGLGTIYEVIADIEEYFHYNEYYGAPINRCEDIYFVKKDDNPRQSIAFAEDSPYSMMMPGIYFNNALDIKDKENLSKKIEENAVL